VRVDGRSAVRGAAVGFGNERAARPPSRTREQEDRPASGILRRFIAGKKSRARQQTLLSGLKSYVMLPPVRRLPHVGPPCMPHPLVWF
jgi:hypothetical protein